VGADAPSVGGAAAGGSDVGGTAGASGGAGGIGTGGSVPSGSGGRGAGGSGGAAIDGNNAGGVGAGGIDGGRAGGGVGGGAGGIATGGSGGQGAREDGAVGGAGGVRLDGGAAGGMGGTNGTGGSTARSCPDAAPANGSDCGYLGTSLDECYYEDCAHVGLTVASCWSGTWKVSTQACGPIPCSDISGSVTTTCQAGQVCVQLQMAAVCSTPACGTGPITQSCVPDATGYCNLRGTLAGGVSLWCCPGAGTGC
jgi:hypothetical protein